MDLGEYSSTQVIRRFNVSPEKVFDAWLDKSLLGKWQLVALYPDTARLDVDARVGGGYRFSEWIWGEEYVQLGTYVEIERPKRLIIDESFPKHGGNTGRVMVEIAPRQEGCDLTVTVGTPSSEGSQYSIRYGWAIMLEKLASTLTSIEAADTSANPDPRIARATRHIKAAPEHVFDAWLDPDLLGQWMFGPDVRDEEILHLKVNPKVGGSFSFLVRRGDMEIDHIGEYLEIDRPLWLVFTWGVRQDEGTEFSRVEVEVAPIEGGSELKISQVLTPKWADFVDQAQGAWQRMADALARLVE
ncbi:MAG: SRPBCC domain-containing protein [Candidatus Hydrogenedentes bacterium]|nr:SRPBCC domain-containing protein [Candidatus Hydrogenedentota bacterium]